MTPTACEVIDRVYKHIDDAREGCYFIDDHKGKSLRKSELTSAQASPLDEGNAQRQRERR